MNTNEFMNYELIAKVIDYIRSNPIDQPNLEEIAEYMELSAYHFQKLFTEWAGTSPEKFLQYISIGHAKGLLRKNQALASGTNRQHDGFISIEGMTSAENKSGGDGMAINYSTDETPFGSVLIASTAKGICYMAFYDDEADAVKQLLQHLPKAKFNNKSNEMHLNALSVFSDGKGTPEKIRLHLKGTDFQLKVWESLLRIPMGQLSSYGDIARYVDKPSSSRAVGSAVGSNPVAYLIPCHRVIQSTGVFGGYMWGETRKAAIIGWEGAKAEK
jgi:AraC family transcriptional regulator, regulatory protein of adaptative response / methylated-DNA-[protein]-cysteine methyltransferase